MSLIRNEAPINFTKKYSRNYLNVFIVCHCFNVDGALFYMFCHCPGHSINTAVIGQTSSGFRLWTSWTLS